MSKLGRDGDYGTPERARQDELVTDLVNDGELGAVKRKRVLRQVPLDRYLGRGEITRAQHDAGEKLQLLYERSGLRQRTTMRYAPRIDSGGLQAPGGAQSDTRLEVMKRLRRALDAVGPMGRGILWAVCCDGRMAGDWAVGAGYRNRDGIVLLRFALDLLAAHFGFAAAPHGSSGTAAKAQ